LVGPQRQNGECAPIAVGEFDLACAIAVRHDDGADLPAPHDQGTAILDVRFAWGGPSRACR